MRSRFIWGMWLAMGAILAQAAGCRDLNTEETASPAEAKPNEGAAASPVFVSVTSDPVENPQAVDMALKFAGFALDEKRPTVLFFTVKGVQLPTAAFPADFAFPDNPPLKAQLAGLIERGLEVHVCPVCMKAFKIVEGDLVPGAQVTTRPKLFSHIGPATCVFTF